MNDLKPEITSFFLIHKTPSVVPVALLLVLYFSYLIKESLRQFSYLPGILLLLVINTALLGLSVLLFKKLFWDGVGVWGVSPGVKEIDYGYSVYAITPYINIALLFNILLAGISSLILVCRMVQLYRQ